MPAFDRVAVLSDIHGVLPALEAVLAEPEVATADRIVLTGDITAEPQPTEVLALLRAQGERVLWISDNADRELVEYRKGERPEIPDPIAPYAAARLTDENVSSFPRSPPPAPAPAPSPSAASARSSSATPLPATTRRSCSSTRAQPAGRRSSGTSPAPSARSSAATPTCRTSASPTAGSVGMPYGRPGAHWCLLGPGTDLRVTPYDIPAAVERLVAECDGPGIAEWADYYLNARATDTEALETFGGRDGRAGS